MLASKKRNVLFGFPLFFLAEHVLFRIFFHRVFTIHSNFHFFSNSYFFGFFFFVASADRKEKGFFALNSESRCVTLGTAAQFGAAWTTYHPRMCSLQRRWMWMIAIWIGILANIQDFRDMRGDRKRGRRTLPLVIGVLPARKLMALLCVLLGLILHSFLYRSSSILANSVRNSIFVWHLVLAVRIFNVRSTRGDQITYKYYLSFLYCFIVLCSFVFLKTLN